ncbi:MAG TPA: nucleotide exchange factor GrpE [Methylomirabilota bacterium]|jgi:molecular chaperone GrpE
MPSSHASEEGEPRSRQAAPATPDEAAPEPESDGRQGAELAELRERCAQLDDRWRRALADLDNYRKRAARDVERRVAESRDRLLLDWLEPLDSVERALRAEPENPLFEGLRAVLEQMEAILERHGVRRIGAVGEPFDPQQHEAVGTVITDVLPDRTVADVTRSGFTVDDRVLRPAQVVVARQGKREA